MEGRIWRHLTNCGYVDVLHRSRWIKTSLKPDLQRPNEIICAWTWISQLVSSSSCGASALSSCTTWSLVADRPLPIRPPCTRRVTQRQSKILLLLRHSSYLQLLFGRSNTWRVNGPTHSLSCWEWFEWQLFRVDHGRFSLKVSEMQLPCVHSTVFLLLMFSLLTQIVTKTDSHFFFYFKNSESVIRWELWHFPVKWFDSPTVISSVISPPVISSSQAVMSSSQASCLVPVCLNEILPADEAFANKRKKHMSSFSSGE